MTPSLRATVMAAVTAALTFASIAAVPVVPTARPLAAAVPMAGQVTIEAPAGVSGIRLQVPDIGAPVRHDNSLSTVDAPYEGEYGLVLTAEPLEEPYPCGQETQRFCSMHALEIVPDRLEPEVAEAGNGLVPPDNMCNEDMEDGTRAPCPIVTSTYDVYVAVDAPVTFTLHFPALAGSVTYETNGTPVGVYEKTPITSCPTDDCDRLAIGSSEREVGTEEANGIVWSYAYARADYARIRPGTRSALLASIGAEACTYPSYLVPSGSTDAEDHPLGCEFTPTVTEQGDVEYDSFTLRTYVLNMQAQAVSVSMRWPFLNGEKAYAGFNVRNDSAAPMYEGAQGAWAVWLEQGIYAP